MPSVRLQKFLADAGVSSRRAGERLIAAGSVSVNGRVVTELGAKVDPLHDEVALDGRAVRARRKLYIALHKPRGYLCTRIDPGSRRLVGDLLPREWGNLFTVGRLDRDSEGLIFLTNDGDFSLRLTHPRYGVRKKYVAVVEARLEPSQIAAFTRGVRHNGELLKAERVRLIDATASRSVVELELAQGKNREVRRLFEVLGHEVVELKRIQIGPIRLGELPVGKWRALVPAEIRSLLADPAEIRTPPPTTEDVPKP
jgi:23S rRNA pseudouridine2605 synthase